MLFKIQLAVYKLTDDKAVEHGHRAALCRGEQAEAHSEDDAEGEEQAPEGDERLLEHFLGRGELVARGGVIALVRDHRHDDHHRDTHQDAGDIAGCKDAAEGGLGNQGVDDQVHAGRDDRGRRGGRSGDGGGERLGIAALFHLGDQHLRLHGAVGVGGAGAAAHQHAQQHVDLGKAALHVARDAFTEVHHLV